MMVRKNANRTEDPNLSIEVAALPTTEGDNAVLPITESESESETSALSTAESVSEITTLPITVSVNETDITALPMPEIEVEALFDEDDKERQDIKSLQLKIAELEDKFAELLVELNSYVNKKKKKKDNKEKIVNCKCKEKKVKLAKCKCKSKKAK